MAAARASDNPWAKPTSPPAFMTNAVRHTLTVRAENDIRRIVITSAVGAGDSRRVANPLFRALLAVSNIKHGYRDHNGVGQLVRNPSADWTLSEPSPRPTRRLPGCSVRPKPGRRCPA